MLMDVTFINLNSNIICLLDFLGIFIRLKFWSLLDIFKVCIEKNGGLRRAQRSFGGVNAPDQRGSSENTENVRYMFFPNNLKM